MRGGGHDGQSGQGEGDGEGGSLRQAVGGER